eukprot:TRINITY_DN11629_c0_g1_i2.p1 TRINITY_DN11629_c0_g1~~TRINITY_DN11629_c0_g1_i2.p1  ORF type:complete len:1070 (+),score=280.25 TRINITY_DN11629_c0_g1_i2:54-3212(+)
MERPQSAGLRRPRGGADLVPTTGSPEAPGGVLRPASAPPGRPPTESGVDLRAARLALAGATAPFTERSCPPQSAGLRRAPLPREWGDWRVLHAPPAAVVEPRSPTRRPRFAPSHPCFSPELSYCIGVSRRPSSAPAQRAPPPPAAETAAGWRPADAPTPAAGAGAGGPVAAVLAECCGVLRKVRISRRAIEAAAEPERPSLQQLSLSTPAPLSPPAGAVVSSPITPCSPSSRVSRPRRSPVGALAIAAEYLLRAGSPPAQPAADPDAAGSPRGSPRSHKAQWVQRGDSPPRVRRLCNRARRTRAAPRGPAQQRPTVRKEDPPESPPESTLGAAACSPLLGQWDLTGLSDSAKRINQQLAPAAGPLQRGADARQAAPAGRTEQYHHTESAAPGAGAPPPPAECAPHRAWPKRPSVAPSGPAPAPSGPAPARRRSLPPSRDRGQTQQKQPERATPPMPAHNAVHRSYHHVLRTRLQREQEHRNVLLCDHERREARRAEIEAGRGSASRGRRERALGQRKQRWILRVLASLPAIHFATVVLRGAAWGRIERLCLPLLRCLLVRRRAAADRVRMLSKELPGVAPQPPPSALAQLPAFARWPPDLLRRACAAAVLRPYRHGEAAVRQGEGVTALHIVAHGAFSAAVWPWLAPPRCPTGAAPRCPTGEGGSAPSTPGSAESKGGPALPLLAPGEVFGQAAVAPHSSGGGAVHSGTYAAAAEGGGPSACWEITAAALRQLVGLLPVAAARELSGVGEALRLEHLKRNPLRPHMLQQHPVLQPWGEAVLQSLCDAAAPRCYPCGALVFRAGDAHAGFTVVVSGELHLTGPDNRGRGPGAPQRQPPAACGEEPPPAPERRQVARARQSGPAVVGVAEAVFGSVPRPCSAAAATEAGVWVVPREAVSAALERDRGLCTAARAAARAALHCRVAPLPESASAALATPGRPTAAKARSVISSHAEPWLFDAGERLAPAGGGVSRIFFLCSGQVQEGETVFEPGAWVGLRHVLRSGAGAVWPAEVRAAAYSTGWGLDTVHVRWLHRRATLSGPPAPGAPPPGGGP